MNCKRSAVQTALRRFLLWNYEKSMRLNERLMGESPSSIPFQFPTSVFCPFTARPHDPVAAPPEPHATCASLGWQVATRTGARDSKMTPELNWCGQPIGPGESYGGKPEHISETWGQKPALAAAKHYEVITESDVAEVFGFGEHKLTRAEAAKRLERLTHTHRTAAYRALRPHGRFGGHLCAEGKLPSWR